MDGMGSNRQLVRILDERSCQIFSAGRGEKLVKEMEVE